MARIKDAEMEKRKRLAVSYLEEKTSSSRPLRATYGAMANDLGLSVRQLRRVISALEDEGIVCVTKRFSDLGAQLENSYRLTPRGRRIMKMDE